MNDTNISYQLGFDSGIPLASLQAGEHYVVPYVFVSLSLAVNLVVIVAVSVSRQLHQPRHVYWAGISISVILYTVDWLIKAFIRSESDVVACTIYKITICVSYPSLLSSLSLAGLDRYLAIERYEWYKRKMTNKKAVVSMICALLFNSVVFHSPYLAGFLKLNDCFYDLTHCLCFVGWSVSLGFVNVILQVKVFVVSMKTIRYYFSGVKHPVLQLRRPSAREFHHFTAQSSTKAIAMNTSNYHPGLNAHFAYAAPKEIQCFPTRTFDRLDFRAALIFSVNVLPLVLCTIPLGLNTMAMCICSQWKLDCSNELMLQTDAYLKYSVFTPCIAMPLMYMWSSKEFQRAFLHLFWKIESRASSVNRSFNRRTLDHLN